MTLILPPRDRIIMQLDSSYDGGKRVRFPGDSGFEPLVYNQFMAYFPSIVFFGEENVVSPTSDDET